MALSGRFNRTARLAAEIRTVRYLFNRRGWLNVGLFFSELNLIMTPRLPVSEYYPD